MAKKASDKVEEEVVEETAEEVGEEVKEEKKVKKTEETAEEVGEKMVKIRIPLSRGEDEGDVFLSVNERTFGIKRGETVEVPASVAAAYKDSERQKERRYKYLNSIAK